MKKLTLNYFIRYILFAGLTTAISFSTFAKNSENSTALIEESGQKILNEGVEYLSNTIQKSPNDKALYQGIRLKNGMTVLLISDAKANKSLMSAAISIGSMEDPLSQQGLAHYLEHMILMGSKHYPETNSFDKFLNANGGYNNASTTPQRTAYYFEVNNNAFDEAVARFADTLAFPLLLESNAKKEVNAVNAEMVQAKSSDSYLLHSVNLATANPAHPMTKFAVGNNETLSDKPNSKLQEELIAFYQKYYSANLFKAVLYSNQSIEDLAKLAANTLGKMPNKHLQNPIENQPLFRAQDKGVMIQYKPIQPIKMLSISFDMPNDEDKFKAKSNNYLAYLFNNNTEGTLSDYLIKQGFSDNGVSATSTPNFSRNRGNFTFYVMLTEKGVREKDKIISLIFQQIEKVKKEGIKESYFNELRESLKQAFAHLQIEKDADYIESLSDMMLSYPIEHILDANYIVTAMDKSAIKEKLERMHIENARITFVEENAKIDQFSPYFKAGYSIEKIGETQKKKWLDFSKNPELKLPELNPYFATDFSLIKEEKRAKPQLIKESIGERIFAMPSEYFADDPKARLAMRFTITPRRDDLKESTSAVILDYMNSLAQTKLAFQSSVAGIQSNIHPTQNGVVIRAEGYTQHLPKLVVDSLRQFNQFELNEAFLIQAKQRLIEALDSRKTVNSLQQANTVFSDFAHYPYYNEDKQRKIIDEITLQDIQQIREKLLSQTTGVKVLSVGNLSDDQVKALTAEVASMLGNKNREFLKHRYLDVNESTRKINVVTKVLNEDNALSIAFMAKGYDEMVGLANALLLEDIISRWYFNDLRTSKQLGYVVSANHTRIGKTAGLQFMVQSPNTTPKDIMAHNQRFFAESFTKLTALTEAEFAQFKDSLLDKLMRKPESLDQEFNRYTHDLMLNNAKFDYREKMVEAVEKLTKQDILTYYQDTVISQKGLVLLSQALGTKTKASDVAILNGFENIDDLEALQKTFKVKFYE